MEAAAKPCCVCHAPGGKHCTKCKSRHYCGKKCQLVDWNEGGHKAQCRQLAVEFQDRLLDELMPLKIKEAPAIVEDVAPAAGLKAAPRLPAARTGDPADAKASALKDDVPSWRRPCGICLDVIPAIRGKTFYSCCCMRICTVCANKCGEYDTRCPLCRTFPCKSDAERVRRLQKHVDEGNADAQVQLGDAYRTGGMGLKKSLKRAIPLYERAAAQGHAPAQNSLGCHYENGDGVKIDYKTAAQLFRRAAEQGHPEAQNNLGCIFNIGNGVVQSHEEAVRWWRLAAHNLVDALYNLGVCYEIGQGLPQDDHEALRLYKRAAAKGHAGAAAAVDKVVARLAAARAGQPT